MRADRQTMLPNARSAAFPPSTRRSAAARVATGTASLSHSPTATSAAGRGELSRLKVVVRIRPQAEGDLSPQVVANIPSPSHISIVPHTSDHIRHASTTSTTCSRPPGRTHSISGTKECEYDKVYTPTSGNAEIFKDTVVPMVREAMKGYQCTVFAYGQTGTGKTHTMEGSEDDPGLIQRTFKLLFDTLSSPTSDTIDYTVTCTHVEIYNEDIRDLLTPMMSDYSDISVRSSPTAPNSVILHNATAITISSLDEAQSMLNHSNSKRATAQTDLNSQSSRSHAILTITIQRKFKDVAGQNKVSMGKVNLVDLAGSENAGRSGANRNGKRMQEASNINKSLLTLGQVITKLVARASHIPYRESKLTRILQESLGGRAMACMIATVSPSKRDLEETLSTLNYASNARQVKNDPTLNQELCESDVLATYQRHIQELQRELHAAREKHGVFLPRERYEELVQMERKKQECASVSKSEINDLVQKMEAMRTRNELLEADCEEREQALRNKETEVERAGVVFQKAQEGFCRAMNRVRGAREEEWEYLVKALDDRVQSLVRDPVEDLAENMETFYDAQEAAFDQAQTFAKDLVQKLGESHSKWLHVESQINNGFVDEMKQQQDVFRAYLSDMQQKSDDLVDFYKVQCEELKHDFGECRTAAVEHVDELHSFYRSEIRKIKDRNRAEHDEYSQKANFMAAQHTAEVAALSTQLEKLQKDLRRFSERSRRNAEKLAEEREGIAKGLGRGCEDLGVRGAERSRLLAADVEEKMAFDGRGEKMVGEAVRWNAGLREGIQEVRERYEETSAHVGRVVSGVTSQCDEAISLFDDPSLAYRDTPIATAFSQAQSTLQRFKGTSSRRLYHLRQQLPSVRLFASDQRWDETAIAQWCDSVTAPVS